MSTLDDLTAERGPGGLVGFVSALSERWRPVRRRDVLVGATVAAAALATKPKEYVLRPVAAYATICGPGNTASSGWTVFCCTVNRGVNACPPGSFAAGWWKAADSSWCGNGYRYIVDCNASCSKCTTGCTDGMCDSRCWSCSCGTGSSATCDQRRVCCNAFRYGQCNTQVKCSGGVHCRVVSCVAPYTWASCTTTSLQDDRTSEHSAPCLPQWSHIEEKYKNLGAQRSYLRASIGPARQVGDGRGAYVQYQGGAIYFTSTTRAIGVTEFIRTVYAGVGGPTGVLGYPTRDKQVGLPADGWIQLFEKGAVTDSSATSTQVVSGAAWTAWVANGREAGPLGYPTGARAGTAGGGWLQPFQKGAVCDSTTTSTQAVYGAAWTAWVANGREGGRLGYPSGPRTATAAGGWVQTFTGGAVCDSTTTSTQAVSGGIFSCWRRVGREGGVLGYPTQGMATDARGVGQAFEGGEVWALGADTGYAVRGAVLAAWKDAGGVGGRYGYPLTDTADAGDGQLTCTFEGGTITA